jgi:undecaprenyl-diphosphatase
MRYAEPKPLVHAPTDASFPSGHAATSFAAATVLSFAWPRWAPAFFLLALAIGFSRVYVGVHYPLDIVGGALLGIGVAIALRWLLASRRRSRAEL